MKTNKQAWEERHAAGKNKADVALETQKKADEDEIKKSQRSQRGTIGNKKPAPETLPITAAPTGDATIVDPSTVTDTTTKRPKRLRKASH